MSTSDAATRFNFRLSRLSSTLHPLGPTLPRCPSFATPMHHCIFCRESLDVSSGPPFAHELRQRRQGRQSDGMAREHGQLCSVGATAAGARPQHALGSRVLPVSPAALSRTVAACAKTCEFAPGEPVYGTRQVSRASLPTDNHSLLTGALPGLLLERPGTVPDEHETHPVRTHLERLPHRPPTSGASCLRRTAVRRSSPICAAPVTT